MNRFKDRCECCGKYKKCNGFDGKLMCDECRRIYTKNAFSENKKIITNDSADKKIEQTSLFGLGGLFNE